MMDTRRKDVPWNVADGMGATHSWPEVQVAVLMDLRDELKQLNRLLGCKNFIDVPVILRGIRSNTKKAKRKR